MTVLTLGILFQAKLSFGPIVVFDPISLPETSLLSPAVIKELGLKRDSIDAERQLIYERTRKFSLAKRAQEVAKFSKKIYLKLTPDQKSRYVELVRQGYGPTSLLCKGVPQNLKLSPQQMNSFRSQVLRLSARFQREAFPVRKDAKKLAGVTQQYEGRIDLALTSLMSSEQARQWSKSLGAPSRVQRRPGCLSFVAPR